MLCVFLNIFPLIYLDIAKPRLPKKILPILFALNEIISQFQSTKLCASPFIANHHRHLLTIASQAFIQYPPNLPFLHTIAGTFLAA